ncbi:hypothetical protein Ae201684P_022353 [Aphanomyces euteiches]|nr:hypothetical protein Ae201684P_022353 [Aphanomyces euteiches]
MDRFVKCPSCKVNIPKQDVVEKDGQAICTVCKKPFSAELLSATPVPVAAPKTTTKRRWIELKSKRGKTYYHNNETGEDRWDMPPDFDVVATVAAGAESAPPAMADDPVRNAIMLQQNKQDARKQGLPEDMIEALAAQQAAQQASNSLHEAIAAMEKQSKQAKQQQLQTKSQPESPRAAPSSSSVAESTPDTQEAQSSGSSCTLM